FGHIGEWDLDGALGEEAGIEDDAFAGEGERGGARAQEPADELEEGQNGDGDADHGQEPQAFELAPDSEDDAAADREEGEEAAAGVAAQDVEVHRPDGLLLVGERFGDHDGMLGRSGMVADGLVWGWVGFRWSRRLRVVRQDEMDAVSRRLAFRDGDLEGLV